MLGSTPACGLSAGHGPFCSLGLSYQLVCVLLLCLSYPFLLTPSQFSSPRKTQFRLSGIPVSVPLPFTVSLHTVIFSNSFFVIPNLAWGVWRHGLSSRIWHSFPEKKSLKVCVAVQKWGPHFDVVCLDYDVFGTDTLSYPVAVQCFL